MSDLPAEEADRQGDEMDDRDYLRGLPDRCKAPECERPPDPTGWCQFHGSDLLRLLSGPVGDEIVPLPDGISDPDTWGL